MKKRFLSLLFPLVLLLSILPGCGQNADAPAAPVATAAPAQTSEPSSAQVAGAEDMTEVVEVVEDGMEPVYAESLREGVYPVAMKSSSSMFKADHCELTVADGALWVTLYMNSEAYSHMYAGTAQEAAAAESGDYIPLAEDSDGMNSFTLPIDALDTGVFCAAFSKRKELWYDRTLLLRADSLPLEAFAEGMFTTPESLGLADGSYTVDVSLKGGSGKASVQSPAQLTVQNGVFTARIEWGSSHYDYMKVDGSQYLPVNTEGNSAFEIPVSVFDREMPVVADTTAMSQPYEIEYSLLFDSASIQPAP